MESNGFLSDFEFNVLICEDEMVNLRINEMYIREISKESHLNPVIFLSNTVDSNPLEIAKKNRIDIAFMDIELKEYNGIELAVKLQKINPETAVIFITSYTEYCQDAFRIRAFGYVQKPIREEELKSYFLRAVTYLRGLHEEEDAFLLQFIENREMVTIQQKNIIYIEKVQRKVNVVTCAKIFRPYMSISDLEKLLNSNFIKINQGTLINIKEVFFQDNRVITMNNGEELIIGRTYIKNLRNKFQGKR